MNSPVELQDPTNNSCMQFMSLSDQRTQRELQYIADQRRGYKQTQTYLAKFPHESTVDKVFNTIGEASTLVGAASTFNPIVAPIAAIGGLTYGTYKLGKSFQLW